MTTAELGTGLAKPRHKNPQSSVRRGCYTVNSCPSHLAAPSGGYMCPQASDVTQDQHYQQALQVLVAMDAFQGGRTDLRVRIGGRFRHRIDLQNGCDHMVILLHRHSQSSSVGNRHPVPIIPQYHWHLPWHRPANDGGAWHNHMQ